MPFSASFLSPISLLAILMNSLLILVHMNTQKRTRLRGFRYFVLAGAVLDIFCALLMAIMEPLPLAINSFSIVLPTGIAAFTSFSQILNCGGIMGFGFFSFNLMHSFVYRMMALHSKCPFIPHHPKVILSVLVTLEFTFLLQFSYGLTVFCGPNNHYEMMQNVAERYCNTREIFAYWVVDVHPVSSSPGTKIYFCQAIIVSTLVFVVVMISIIGVISALRNTCHSIQTRKLHRILLISLIAQLFLSFGLFTFPLVAIAICGALEISLGPVVPFFFCGILSLVSLMNPVVVFLFIAEYRRELCRIFALLTRRKK